MSFRAFRKFSVGIGDPVENELTCASACTPASVRPDPCGRTFWPVNRPIAEASVPWIVAASGCSCQPEKSVPSYASVNLRLRLTFVPSPRWKSRHLTGRLQSFTRFGVQRHWKPFDGRLY